jgi:transcription-repair coupling factor (superfamily II helicase)
VSNIGERLVLYKDLDNCETEEDLVAFRTQLKDRFGPIPKSTEELINTVRMRWLAQSLGFEKIVLKQKTLIAHFVLNQQSAYYQSEIFTGVIQFIQQGKLRGRLREKNDKLSIVVENVNSIDQLVQFFSSMIEFKPMQVK